MDLVKKTITWRRERRRAHEGREDEERRRRVFTRDHEVEDETVSYGKYSEQSIVRCSFM